MPAVWLLLLTLRSSLLDLAIKDLENEAEADILLEGDPGRGGRIVVKDVDDTEDGDEGTENAEGKDGRGLCGES